MPAAGRTPRRARREHRRPVADGEHAVERRRAPAPRCSALDRAPPVVKPDRDRVVAPRIVEQLAAIGREPQIDAEPRGGSSNAASDSRSSSRTAGRAGRRSARSDQGHLPFGGLRSTVPGLVQVRHRRARAAAGRSGTRADDRGVAHIRHGDRADRPRRLARRAPDRRRRAPRRRAAARPRADPGAATGTPAPPDRTRRPARALLELQQPRPRGSAAGSPTESATRARRDRAARSCRAGRSSPRASSTA